MNYINTVLRKSKNYLKQNGIVSADLDSELLLSSVIKKPREYIIINSNKIIDNKQMQLFENLIERRKKKEPIAYILKKKDFWKS